MMAYVLAFLIGGSLPGYLYRVPACERENWLRMAAQGIDISRVEKSCRRSDYGENEMRILTDAQVPWDWTFVGGTRYRMPFMMPSWRECRCRS